MHFIVVRYQVKPECADTFLDQVAAFTEATRNEPGNKWFNWYRSVDDPNEFLLNEAFTLQGAAEHVKYDHFQEGLDAMRPLLAATPRIISRQIDGEDWDEMGELQI